MKSTSKATMNLTLDFGNSRVKLGIFNRGELIHVSAYPKLHLKVLSATLKKFPVQSAIMVSVVKNTEYAERFLKSRTAFVKLSYTTKLPVKNHYETPRTLGMDRIANLMGARSFFLQKDVLVISAGTCITYDLITRNGDFFGGNITPGIDMRLKSMNTFTAGLPLVKKEMTGDLFGKNTSASMITGVVNGIAFEMQGFISAYKKKYPSVKVILTGGDSSFFEKRINRSLPQRKSKIFVASHLVLYGLNEILLLNDGR